MTCYRPLRAYRSTKANANGKYPLIFPKGKKLPEGEGLDIACGRCIGCRLDHSRDWALRIMHEAARYKENCFITLTYSDEKLPHDNSLDKRHWQLFMKRLRKSYEPQKIRFFHCGEYGEQFRRPHYHACIFGLDFEDKVIHGKNHRGDPIYTSRRLAEIWDKGFVTVGELNFDSAAYVARYCLKKVTGEQAEEHYKSVNWATGEIVDLLPEYTLMSRGGRKGKGIGHDYYLERKDNIYPLDQIVYKSGTGKYRPMKPPKYYDRLYELDCPEEMEKIKERRQKRSKFSKDNTDRRLRDREEVKQRQISQCRRKL